MTDWALALDIGGTKIGAGVVSADGELVSVIREPTEHSSAEALYDQVLRLLLAARADAEAEAGAPLPIAAVGVGSGGPGRDHHRLLSPLNIPAWRDFPLRERLAADLTLPVFVDNDAKAMALAEGWLGAAVGVANYIGMVVSTGVGGGIVLEGRLLDGADGNAGHIGHIFVQEGGRADAAGAVGLLEGQASGSAIAALTGAHPSLADPATRERAGQLVGRAVAAVANLLDLQLAVVAGSVALGYGEPFFAAAQREIDHLCLIQHARGTRIVPAKLGDEAPLVGAAAVAWRGLGRFTAIA